MSVYVKPPINQPPVAKGGLFSFGVIFFKKYIYKKNLYFFTQYKLLKTLKDDEKLYFLIKPNYFKNQRSSSSFLLITKLIIQVQTSLEYSAG